MVALPVWVEEEDVELCDERIPGNILVWGADELAVHRHAVAVPLPRVDHACSLYRQRLKPKISVSDPDSDPGGQI
jgi:hypothetical protein